MTTPPTPATDYGWPSIRLSAGPTELVLVPGIGGRLMGIRQEGQELLFVNPKLRGTMPDLDALRGNRREGPQKTFPLWGGEKTWVAPQSAWPHGCPPPDLDSAPYAAEIAPGDGMVTLLSPTCSQTGLQIERTIKVTSAGEWSTLHVIRNRGTRPTYAGPWSVMMVSRDCTVVIPAAGKPVAMGGDTAEEIGACGALTTVHCHKPIRFKTGHLLAEGWIGTFAPRPGGGAVMITSFCDVDAEPASFAHGHPAEVYNSDVHPYCEVELHGVAKMLAPGSELQWQVRSQVRSLATMPQTELEVRESLRLA